MRRYEMDRGLENHRQSNVIAGITTKELAKLAEETYDTIDHWAGEGLLPYQKKGRIRIFSADDCMDRCKRIRELQNQDFNLAAIRHTLNKSE